MQVVILLNVCWGSHRNVYQHLDVPLNAANCGKLNVHHGIDQIDCNMFFELEQGTVTRGHSLKIKKVRVNNRRRQCALGVRAINNWNSLTDNIVLSDNINQFKTRLERFWSEKESKFDPTRYHGLIM